MSTTGELGAPGQPLSGPIEGRVFSIDAFRGFTMVCLIAEGFGFSHLTSIPAARAFAQQFTQVEWEGMHAWDLVQPFFMFVVGLAMPFSFARRWKAGESWNQSLLHVLRRSGMLIALGLIARSISAGRPNLDLINVLAQIAFTYLVAFLVLKKSWRFQAMTVVGLLVFHWALFQFVSAPGVEGPWVREANIGWYLDTTILGKTWGGAYVTINCISSAGNTLFGVMAGKLLMSALPAARKSLILAATGVGGILIGLALSPFIPLVKRIWTASFTFYSGGFTLLALLVFYWICDLKMMRRWAKVFIIVGSNSIFIYLFSEILGRWLEHTGLVFTGWAVNLWGPWGEFLNAWVVLIFEIYLFTWIYRRNIFIRI